jgi:TRAP-type mannitol/chloroaromatic compound transport system permease small subunit
MWGAIAKYVKVVDAVNYRVGSYAMYLVVVMIAVLFYSTISKSFFNPSLWTLEVAQFTMVAYYLLGGGYTLQNGSHVRMDLLYGKWSPKTKSAVDAFTILFLIFYLVILLRGGISSTEYALEYGERGRSIWRPYLAPIKIIACIGILLMLLQAVAELFKDIARLKNINLGNADFS